MGKRTYYVYILASDFGSIYVGVTNDLERRLAEHCSKAIEGFTKKYNLTRLVYLEETGEIDDALAREKQIKGWRRSKKVLLIERLNPMWADLSDPSMPPAQQDKSCLAGGASLGMTPHTPLRLVSQRPKLSISTGLVLYAETWEAS